MRHLGGGLRLCFGKWLVTVPCTGLSTVPRPPLHSASLHYSPQVYRESYWDTPPPPPRRGLSLTRPPPPSLQGGRVDCAIASSRLRPQPRPSGRLCSQMKAKGAPAAASFRREGWRGDALLILN